MFNKQKNLNILKSEDNENEKGSYKIKEIEKNENLKNQVKKTSFSLSSKSIARDYNNNYFDSTQTKMNPNPLNNLNISLFVLIFIYFSKNYGIFK